MNNLLCMMAEGGDSGIWIIVVMLVFLAFIIFTSIVPQKKRQKEMMEMLSTLKVGEEVKTIGGMIGKIAAIEENGLLVINVGTEESPTYIKFDRVAIYSVARKPEAVPAAQEEGVESAPEKLEDPFKQEEVKSEDAKEEAKSEEK